MLVFIDNYDSFTFNLVQYFRMLGQEVMVIDNDAMTVKDIEPLGPDALILGPGPSTPNNAGITLEAVKHFAGKLPILGICLGHQAIAQAFGASVVRAERIMHGRTSLVHHNNNGLFTGLTSPTPFTRYHSLLVAKDTIPACLKVTAWTLLKDKTSLKDKVPTEDKTANNTPERFEIMAIQHQELPIYGVQFHPESILSKAGMLVLANFLSLN